MSFSANQPPITPFDEATVPDVWDLPRDFDTSNGVGRSTDGVEFRWLQGTAVPLGSLASAATQEVEVNL